MDWCTKIDEPLYMAIGCALKYQKYGEMVGIFWYVSVFVTIHNDCLWLVGIGLIDMMCTESLFQNSIKCCLLKKKQFDWRQIQ